MSGAAIGQPVQPMFTGPAAVQLPMLLHIRLVDKGWCFTSVCSSLQAEGNGRCCVAVFYLEQHQRVRGGSALQAASALQDLPGSALNPFMPRIGPLSSCSHGAELPAGGQ